MAKGVSDTNAATLDKALEALVAYLTRVNEAAAARCAFVALCKHCYVQKLQQGCARPSDLCDAPVQDCGAHLQGHGQQGPQTAPRHRQARGRCLPGIRGA